MKPPILLVHGACSQPAHLEPWRAAFAQAGFEVAAPALPGHLPGEEAALRRLGLRDGLAVLRETAGRFGRPPVVIGHSLGGLFAQQFAAAADCAGIVLVGSMPTGTVPLSFGALPFLAPLAPAILAGRPFRVSREGLERLALHDLARAEKDELLPDFVAESGRLYREILFGRARLPAGAVRCPVLVVHGAADRLVPLRVARGLARRWRGELAVIPNHGHWLVAGSLAAIVLPVIGEWIDRAVPAA
ncbi:MAG TPA: alpha/beta fold hydrolase [Bauldia sp.]|nr:alpha/beta fold hydrolase [Bauldia sp.]